MHSQSELLGLSSKPHENGSLSYLDIASSDASLHFAVKERLSPASARHFGKLHEDMYAFAVSLVVLATAQVIQGAVKVGMNKNYVTWAVAFMDKFGNRNRLAGQTLTRVS